MASIEREKGQETNGKIATACRHELHEYLDTLTLQIQSKNSNLSRYDFY